MKLELNLGAGRPMQASLASGVPETTRDTCTGDELPAVRLCLSAQPSAAGWLFADHLQRHLCMT